MPTKNKPMKNQETQHPKCQPVGVSSTGLFGDIPLKNAMLAWNPPAWKREGVVPGLVMVIPYDHPAAPEDHLKLIMTAGAAYSYWHTCTKTQRLLSLYIEAWHIVCRDGIDPRAMHQALMVIPEYRETLSEDFRFPNVPSHRRLPVA